MSVLYNFLINRGKSSNKLNTVRLNKNFRLQKQTFSEKYVCNVMNFNNPVHFLFLNK